MGIVYVPQVPSRWDAGAQLWVPNINIAPAGKWGEIKIMFEQSISRGTEMPMAAIHELMPHFGPDDYVCIAGDLALVALVCCVAAHKAGGHLRMLRWDRQAREYVVIDTPNIHREEEVTQ